jgi:hypothetical protein
MQHMPQQARDENCLCHPGEQCEQDHSPKMHIHLVQNVGFMVS